MGKSYTWCSVISVTDEEIKGDSGSWWDYCGAEDKATNQSMLITQATTHQISQASNPSTTRATFSTSERATTRKSSFKPSRNNTSASNLKAISWSLLFAALTVTFVSI